MFQKKVHLFVSDNQDYSSGGLEDDSEYLMSSEATTLIQRVESGTLTSEQLLEIVKDHSHNISDECDVCYEIGEECLYDLFEQIFETYKDSMSPELIDALASNYEWEHGGDFRTPYRFGVFERRMLDFVLHPMSSLEHLSNSAEYFSEAVHHDWVNETIDEGNLEDYILGHLEGAMAHPRVNADVVQSWKEAIHAFLSDLPMVCEPGPAAECQTCGSLIERARKNTAG